jgi:RNA-directed DNA polymerase
MPRNGGGAKGRRTKERSWRRNWRPAQEASSNPGCVNYGRESRSAGGRAGQGGSGNASFWVFAWTARKRIGIAPESLERFKAKVREKWDGRRSGASTQLRDDWNRYVRGWWGYYRLAEARRPLVALEGWIRRHIRKCFWLRWHDRVGRERNLRRLGVTGRSLGVATSRRGAWGVADQPELQWGLRNSVLRRHGFLLPSDLAAR